ncbi:MAG: hypothetical protein FJX84_04305 [Bacteroidetes bacterium]|nr:hypothetical protein [Bacteroidota bacterium]
MKQSLIFCFIVLSISIFGQTSNCLSNGDGKKPIYDAQKAKKAALTMDSINDSKGAISEYKRELEFRLKAEKICPDFDLKNYRQIQRVITDLMKRDTSNIKFYFDTLNAMLERMDAKSINDVKNNIRAANYLKGTNPNRDKADIFYQKALNETSTKLDDELVQNYYLNIYNIYNDASEDNKSALKERMIIEYFSLSKLCVDKALREGTQTYLTTILNLILKSCEDILPEISVFLNKLPSNKDQKLITVNNLISILEDKDCTSSNEYVILIDTLLNIDRSYKSLLVKAKLLSFKGNTTDAVNLFKEARGMAKNDAEKKTIEDEISKVQERIAAQEYNKVLNLFNGGSYKSAYNAAMGVSGKYKGEALKIAGQCVGQLANGCGSSTFERKCNYYHAVNLLQQAQNAGANVGGLIGAYRAQCPTADEKFDAGNPSSQSLSCWGVSVQVK